MHHPWAPNCMQNLKGGWKFLFPKMFDSYRDLFLSAQTRSMLTRYHESEGENRIPQEEHKDVFQEPVWSFYYGGTIRFIRKKVSVCNAPK